MTIFFISEILKNMLSAKEIWQAHILDFNYQLQNKIYDLYYLLQAIFFSYNIENSLIYMIIMISFLPFIAFTTSHDDLSSRSAFKILYFNFLTLWFSKNKNSNQSFLSFDIIGWILRQPFLIGKGIIIHFAPELFFDYRAVLMLLFDYELALFFLDLIRQV